MKCNETIFFFQAEDGIRALTVTGVQTCALPILGYNNFLRGPWQKHLDVSLIKRTKIGERANVEARAQALNVMNITNFYLGGMSPNSTSFGQITGAYRDVSNGVDPG